MQGGRSIRCVRAKHLWALALGVLSLGGSPPSARPSGPIGRSAPPGPSVSAALQSLQRSGAITEALYRQYYSAYVAAKRSLGKLSGTRRTELGAVLANVQAIAAAGGFTASRLPARCSSRSNATGSGGRPNRCSPAASA